MNTFIAGFQTDEGPDEPSCFLWTFRACTDIIVRDIGDGLVLPLGVDGEICIRTPSMFTAYWNAPRATADASRDGWFHTGDIGQLDENGFLHFLGRTEGGSKSTA